MMKKIFMVVTTLSLFFGQNCFASAEKLASILKAYKDGLYPQAIELAEKLKTGDKKILATKHYFIGISQARLQNFDEAIKHFKRSIGYGVKAEDIHYELGQAQYAANDLESSRKSFKRSYHKKYKASTSLYYMGHISQILEEHKKAKKYYNQILKKEKADKNLRQVARYQLSESMLVLARDKEGQTKRLVKKYILPQFKKAEKINTKTPTAAEIRKRIREIQNEFGLDPNKMVNGRRISKKRHTLSLSQTIEYDNNITLTNDQPSTTATKKDSFVYDTTLNANYKFILKRRFTLKPGFKYTREQHDNQDESEVFTNDNHTLTGSGHIGFEHKLFGKMATLAFDYENQYKGQDKDAIHDKQFYARYNSFALGEKINFFGFGDTSFKFKKKYYRSYDQSLHNDIFTFSLDQVAILKSGHLMIVLFSMDLTDYINDANSSTDSYLIRTDYIIPEIYAGLTLNMAMSITFLDTLANSATRGTEKTYTPSAKLTKKVAKYLSMDIGYEFTKTTSLSSSNEYKKHVTTWGLSLSL